MTDNLAEFGVIKLPQYPRIESGNPYAYRLAQKPAGEIVLQGAFQWTEGDKGGVEWRDIPTVAVALETEEGGT